MRTCGAEKPLVERQQDQKRPFPCFDGKFGRKNLPLLHSKGRNAAILKGQGIGVLGLWEGIKTHASDLNLKKKAQGGGGGEKIVTVRTTGGKNNAIFRSQGLGWVSGSPPLFWVNQIKKPTTEYGSSTRIKKIPVSIATFLKKQKKK